MKPLNRYFKAAFMVAFTALLAAGCTGALEFGDGSGSSAAAVPVDVTLATDSGVGCWTASFAVVNADDTLPSLDSASIADAIQVMDDGGNLIVPTVSLNEAGNQAAICGPFAWCNQYTLAFADGVIATSDGDVLSEVTLPTANLSLVMPDNPGDYDGDCYADFLVGDYSAGTSAGLARLYYGDGSPSDGLSYAEQAGDAGERFGTDFAVTDEMGVTVAGGMNLIIGARTSDELPDTSVGRAYLDAVSPVDDTVLTDLLSARGSETDQRFGIHVGFLGDVNGDGYGDFAAAGRGAPGDPDSSTEARVFLGPWTGDLESADADAILKTDFDTAEGYVLAYNIMGNVDFDGDGIDDIFVSAAYMDKVDQTHAYWKLYFYKGGSSISGDVSPTSAIWGGGADYTTDYNGFGYLYDFADVNGDGNKDLIVAAADIDVTSFAPLAITANYGAAFIYFGPRSMDDSLTYEDADVMISASDEIMGFQVANAGDVNGDGIEDIFVVSLIEPNAPGYPDAKAYLYLGKRDLQGSYGKADADLVISGNLDPLTESMDETIIAAAGTGDVNNDGYDDYVVAAVDQTTDLSSIYLFLGQGEYSGATVYLSDAALQIDPPVPATSTAGMCAMGSVVSRFMDTQYPIDDYTPDPEEPPCNPQEVLCNKI